MTRLPCEKFHSHTWCILDAFACLAHCQRPETLSFRVQGCLPCVTQGVSVRGNYSEIWVGLRCLSWQVPCWCMKFLLNTVSFYNRLHVDRQTYTLVTTGLAGPAIQPHGLNSLCKGFVRASQSQQSGPDISALDTKLQQQWDHDFNQHLGSTVISRFSKIKAGWKCDQCPLGHTHQWQAPVYRGLEEQAVHSVQGIK